ncbi:MAG: elongation factor P maturation arginine rhamnosyltransferase EarP [Pseudomonadota bacterium]|nr:elongation factor P maturation arginine rhamnosyltransferase EarP [Pseudomonadota bacterium]
MQWSVYCRVVDNYGDIGVAWRLAVDLGSRGEHVRLVVDDASALAWMAPGGARNVEVVAWDADIAADGDVWVETFGCGWSKAATMRLEAMPRPPLCIDLEHLSAEAFVARSHGLPLPRFSAAGDAIPTWFYYPGFDAFSGGLLREPGLLSRRRAFGDGRAWLAGRGIERGAGERCVSLFCYPNPALEGVLQELGDRPTLLLLTPGPATTQAEALLARGVGAGRLRAIRLPALPQREFDLLLWSTDLNFVRGEDSLVRAIWAGVPFVWQAYPQHDGAHVAKVEAFLAAFLIGAPDEVGIPVRDLFARWNGLRAPDPATATGLQVALATAWAGHCKRRCNQFAARPDLCTGLLRFVASKR